jgi:hypothetical protein
LLEKGAGGTVVLAGHADANGVRVLGARTVDREGDWTAALRALQVPAASDVIVLIGSERFFCREFDIPAASDEEIGRMVALRLEGELPYGVEEATWAWQVVRDPDRPALAKVFVICVPSAELVAAEQEVAAADLKCIGVECHEVALAQLASSMAPAAATAALVEIDLAGAALVVTRGGRLAYARSVHEPVDRADASALEVRTARLAGELQQSLHGFLLRSGIRPPERLMVLGAGEQAGPALGKAGPLAQVGVEPALLPDWVRLPPDGVRQEDFGHLAACIGALIAAGRRAAGGAVAAPLLRGRPAPRSRSATYRRAALASLCVLLAGLAVASAFWLRVVELRALTKAAQEARPDLLAAERLQEEVAVLERESEQQRSVLDLLLAVTDVLPEGIELSELRIDGQGAVGLSGRAPSVEVASAAVSALGQRPEFEAASLVRASQEKEGLMFKIACRVRRR